MAGMERLCLLLLSMYSCLLLKPVDVLRMTFKSIGGRREKKEKGRREGRAR